MPHRTRRPEPPTHDNQEHSGHSQITNRDLAMVIRALTGRIVHSSGDQ